MVLFVAACLLAFHKLSSAILSTLAAACLCHGAKVQYKINKIASSFIKDVLNFLSRLTLCVMSSSAGTITRS